MSTPAQDRTHFHVEVELIAASKDLGFAAVRVYMALAERCYGPYGERYKAWPSLETLRDETKLHRATVVKAITTLVEKGWLMHAGTSSVKTNVYLLVKRAPPEAIQQAAIVAHRRRSNRRAQATGQSSSTGAANRRPQATVSVVYRRREPEQGVSQPTRQTNQDPPSPPGGTRVRRERRQRTALPERATEQTVQDAQEVDRSKLHPSYRDLPEDLLKALYKADRVGRGSGEKMSIDEERMVNEHWGGDMRFGEGTP